MNRALGLALRHIALACLLALALPIPQPASAQPAGSQGMGRRSMMMDKEDMALMRETLTSVLDAHQTGGTASWTNPKTGIAGTATARRFYQREGRDCADVDAVLASPHRANERNYTLVMCRTAEGWKLAF